MAFNHKFKYLLNGKEVVETKSISASRAIRYNCLDCSGGSIGQVRGCEIENCPLWPFRMGKSRPHLAREQAQGVGVGEENQKQVSG